MHNQSKNTKATKKKKKKFGFFFIYIFYDVMMTSPRHCSSSPPAEHGLVLEKKKKNFSAQNFTHFSSKIHRFPSSNINSSIQNPKIAQKTHNSKNQTSPNFRNPTKWAPKNHKIWWVLLQTIFSTSFQQQSGLKTENQHQTRNKIQKKMASTTGNGKPKN